MTLLFVDSFDHYATDDATKKWTSLYQSGLDNTVYDAVNAVLPGEGRRGTAAAWANNNGGTWNKTLGFRTTWIFGFAFRYTNLIYNMINQ